MRRAMIIGVQLLAVLAGFAGLALAQTQETSSASEVTVVAKPLTESDIALLRQDVQAMKTDLIAKAMQFSDAEAKGFWPLYREYSNEVQKMGENRYQIIKDYAENYDHMSEAKAFELTSKMLDLERQTYENREAYWPQFAKVLGARRAAKFLQIDRRLSLMIDLKLSSEIPVLQ